MRLVAGGALLVACGRGLVLLLVAARARCHLRTRVRFVTLHALLVAGVRLAVLRLVARFAPDLLSRRTMREPVMAVLAGLVPLVRRHLLNALAVAARANRVIGKRELERVGFMAIGARRLAVRTMVGVHERMAGGARAGGCRGAGVVRVRIVAAHAGAGGALFWMIGVNTLVAVRAGGGGRPLHIVG